jgi:hypothetical protein
MVEGEYGLNLCFQNDANKYGQNIGTKKREGDIIGRLFFNSRGHENWQPFLNNFRQIRVDFFVLPFWPN